jgi:uncharacterized membrane protein YoaK (UPF0700 family)
MPISTARDSSNSSVAFVDVLANAVFNDCGNHSIINTTFAGTTFSASTRLGQRCA